MSRGFRIWDKVNKKYIDFSFATFLPSGELVGITTKNGRAPVLAENYTVEQSTGLKDKNGEEIYEGDIVKIVSETWLDPDVGIVGFDENRGVYDLYIVENDKVYWDTGGDFCSLMGRENFTTEVIGNIHENKGLLGGEE